jgi:hypothetical protein
MLEANTIPTDDDTWMFASLPCGHTVVLPMSADKDSFIVGDVGEKKMPLEDCCIRSLREIAA